MCAERTSVGVPSQEIRQNAKIMLTPEDVDGSAIDGHRVTLSDELRKVTSVPCARASRLTKTRSPRLSLSAVYVIT